MPVLKLDLIYEAGGRGWEESYYRIFPSADFSQAATVAQTLAQKRIVLSAPPVVIKAYRMQDPLTAGRQGQVFYYRPPAVAVGPGNDVGAASPDTTINQTWVSNAANKTRLVGLRGIWDSAVTNFNDLNSPAFAAWNTAYVALRTYLLQQGFGWLTRTVAARNVPVSYSISEDATVPVFTFPANTFNILEVTTFKLIRFSRFNGSRSELNRELVVEVTGTNTAKAAAPIAVGPMITGGRAIIYGIPEFVSADSMTVTRVGRRSPGAPLLYTPGRARNRPRT